MNLFSDIDKQYSAVTLYSGSGSQSHLSFQLKCELLESFIRSVRCMKYVKYRQMPRVYVYISEPEMSQICMHLCARASVEHSGSLYLSLTPKFKT